MYGKCTQIDIEFPAIDNGNECEEQQKCSKDIVVYGECAIIDLEFPANGN